MLRGKPSIEADHDAAIGAAVPDDPLRDRLRADPHRVEGVLVGDSRAPAVRAKDDVHAGAPCWMSALQKSRVSRSDSASPMRGDQPVFWRKRLASSDSRVAS